MQRDGRRGANGDAFVIVKVCGVRAPEIAEAAIDAGADWIGLMLVEKSSRWVDDAAALRVVDAVRGRADLVESSSSRALLSATRRRLATVSALSRSTAPSTANW